MHRLKITPMTTLMMLFASTCLAADSPPDEASTVFLKTYCVRCHDAQKQEGKFRLDTLARDFVTQQTAERWAEVLFRINSGEMPPKTESQPEAEELGKVTEWISTRLKEGEAARMARRGPVTLYRLSRDEYAHTVFDLLGVHYDGRLPGGLNEDPRWHGFDRVGALLTLSPSHVDRYLRAADTVITRAFPDQTAQPVKGRRDSGVATPATENAAEVRYREIFWPGVEGPHVHMSSGGEAMLVRIRLSGLRPKGGRAPHLTVWDFTRKRSIFDEDIITPEDQPIVVEFDTTTSSFQLFNAVSGFPGNAHTQSNTARRFINSRQPRIGHPAGYKLFDDEGQPLFPLLLVDSIEWESVPVSEETQRKRSGIFPSVLARNANAPTDPQELEALFGECRESLQRFAERAWRRQVTRDEVERYVRIVQHELAAGESFGPAYRSALIAVLTSKNFYYIEEGDPTKPRDTVNDWEFASRLSYFLWSSMPDDDLFAAGRAGTLKQPDVIKAQLKRMTADPRIARFVEAFPQQWLQLHRVGMFPPDPGLYPDYDKWLEKSMVLETQAYFAEVFARNLPLGDFLKSDWTIVNPRLASFYQLPQLSSSGFQKVRLRPEDHRGGLLTQAAILSLTSDGTRHRPVHRGVWVSEAIFGRTPPPPPPNVEPLEPTPSDKPKATIRDQIQAHTTHATCAACHQKIDPLGLAFDNYDAIGRWRTTEKVAGGLGDDPPVQAGGILPNGKTFQGPDEFKGLLVEDVDRFAEAFVEQLATYALRRVMTVDDKAAIKAIAAQSKPDEYRLRSILENLVLSDLFQKR